MALRRSWQLENEEGEIEPPSLYRYENILSDRSYGADVMMDGACQMG